MQPQHSTMGIAVLAAVSLVQLADCSSSATGWQKMHSECLSNSAAAVLQQQVGNERQCVFAAQSAGGHLVAEFNTNTGQCSVFHHQSVCHLIHAAAAAPDQPSNCTVFATLPVSVNKLNMLRAMKKLRAAWLFDAEFGAEGDNLVCGSSKLWTPSAVSWTKEGAEFDGVNSKMELRDADFGDFSLGFTWLLRLKRQPRHQALMQNFDCDTGAQGAHFSEALDPNCLYFHSWNQFEPNIRIFTNDGATISSIPPGADPFINIGITAVPSADNYTFFSQGSFVTKGVVRDLQARTAATSRKFCFSLGSYSTGTHKLSGTVRAVAIANDTMTQDEMNSFFDWVT